MVVIELAEEFLARYRRGERPSLQEYIDRHPDLAAQFREVLPAMALLENIAIADDSLASPPAQLEAPALTQLGDYRILREIGRGAMGIVYEAEQLSLGRHVALKVLPATLPVDAQRKLRFEREARAAARLHHTNIVPVFGVGSQDGLAYYVMQFIQGLAMSEVLIEIKRLRSHNGTTPPASAPEAAAALVARSLLTGQFEPPPAGASAAATIDLAPGAAAAEQETPTLGGAAPSSLAVPLPGHADGGQKSSSYWHSIARIGVQVASALEYAHHQGILHRDIKPANLLFDTHGTTWVTDFGLAKADDQPDLTHLGNVPGTLRYLPPEAFKGKRGCQSDVYALGLTLYELLALRPAFDEKDQDRLFVQVKRAVPPRLDALNPAIPRDLVTIVHKAIERELSDRYATAADLAADLQRFLDDEPPKARRIGVTERFGRWCRRNPLVASLVAAVILATAAGFATTLWQMQVAWTNADLAMGHAAEVEKKRIEIIRQAYEVGKQRDDIKSLLDQVNTLLQNADSASEQLKKTQARLQANLYVAHINEIPTAIASGNVSRALELLELTRPQHEGPDLRGFEWYYWYRQLHGDRSWKLPFRPDLLPRKATRQYSEDLMRVAILKDPWNSPRMEVWDTVTGQERFTFRWPGGASLCSCKLNADGKRVVLLAKDPPAADGGAAADSWTVQVGDVDARKIIFQRHINCAIDIGSVAISPDGDRLAVFTPPGLHMWSIPGGNKPVVVKIPSISNMAFKFGGQRLMGFIYHDGEYSVAMWDAATGESLLKTPLGKGFRFLGGSLPELGPAVSLSSDHVAFFNDKVHVVNAYTGKKVRSFGSPPSPYIWQWPVFDSTGEKLAVRVAQPLGLYSIYSHDVTIWEVATGRKLLTLTGHPMLVVAVGFSADGRYARTAMIDGTIKEWDTSLIDDSWPPTARLGGTLVVNRQGTRMFQIFAGDGRRARYSSRVLDYSGKELCVFQDGRFAQQSLSSRLFFHPDGLHVFRLSFADSFVELLKGDSETGEVRLALRLKAPFAANRRLDRAEVSPDGKQLVFTLVDQSKRPWRYFTQIVDIDTCVLSPEIEITGGALYGRGPYGRWLLIRFSDCLHAWNAATGKESLVVKAPGFFPFRAAIHPGSLRLVVYWRPYGLRGGRKKPQLKLYDLTTGKEQWADDEWAVDERGGAILDFSPDGKSVVVSGSESLEIPEYSIPVVRVRNASTGKETLTLRGHVHKVECMAFSPDSKRLATLARDQLKLWDMTTGLEVLQLRAAFDSTVFFSPDGQYLINVSRQGWVKRWDAPR
jgi:serine/threonine protein kinase/WD40 repeat protein